jgi:hypothetical protein
MVSSSPWQQPSTAICGGTKGYSNKRTRQRATLFSCREAARACSGQGVGTRRGMRAFMVLRAPASARARTCRGGGAGTRTRGRRASNACACVHRAALLSCC